MLVLAAHKKMAALLNSSIQIVASPPIYFQLINLTESFFFCFILHKFLLFIACVSKINDYIRQRTNYLNIKKQQNEKAITRKNRI